MLLRNIQSLRRRYLFVVAMLLFYMIIITSNVIAKDNSSIPSLGEQGGGAKAPEDKDLTAILDAVNEYVEQGQLNDAKKLIETNLDASPPKEAKDVDRRIKLKKKLEEVEAAIEAKTPKEDNLTPILEAIKNYKDQDQLNDAKKLIETNLNENPPTEKKDVDRRIKLMKNLEEVKAAITAKEQQRLLGLIKQLNETQDEAEKEALRNLLKTELDKDELKQDIAFTAEIERALKQSETSLSPPRPLLKFLRSAIVTLKDPATNAGQILIQVVIYFIFLVFGLIVGVGHPVHDFTRLHVVHVDTMFCGRRAVPLGNAIAAEIGEVHQVDILHLGILAQMLD